MIRERDGRLYQYKSVRKGAKVRTVYQGGGDFAVLGALLDEEDREAREGPGDWPENPRMFIGKPTRSNASAEQLDPACGRDRPRSAGICAVSTQSVEAKEHESATRQRGKADQERSQERDPWARVIALCDDDRSRTTEIARTRSVVPKEFVCDIASIARSVFAKHLFPEAKDDDEPGNPGIRTELQAQIVLNALELAGENPSPARRLCAEVAAYAWAENWTRAARTCVPNRL